LKYFPVLFRQASRQAGGWQAGRQEGRQVGRRAGRQAGRKMKAGIQAERQESRNATDRQRYRKTDVQIYIQTNITKDVLTYTEIHRQTEIQTDSAKVQDGRQTKRQMNR
jgi:hypothetical protein